MPMRHSLMTPGCNHSFWYLVQVYMDDYIVLAIPPSRVQLNHVSDGIMCDIHNIFPPDNTREIDPISLKKIL